VTTIHLVRHGETLWHAENRYAGSSDVALTPRGLEQARELAGWVERRVAAGVRFDAIVTSTLTRAILTALPAAEVLGLVPRADARLCEVHFGRGEGMTRAEMEEIFPDAVAAFLANPATSPLPDAERGVDAVARARAALTEIAAERPVGTVLVVAHSTLTRIVLASLLGMDVERYRDLLPAVGNCHVTSLELDAQGEVALLAYNVPPSA